MLCLLRSAQVLREAYAPVLHRRGTQVPLEEQRAQVRESRKLHFRNHPKENVALALTPTLERERHFSHNSNRHLLRTASNLLSCVVVGVVVVCLSLVLGLNETRANKCDTMLGGTRGLRVKAD